MTIRRMLLESALWTAANVANWKAIVIAQDYFGLGNRIKMLASYHANYGLEDTTLYWCTTGWVNRGFEDLFSLQGIPTLRTRNVSTSKWVPLLCCPTKREFKDRGYWRLDIGEGEIPSDYMISRNGQSFPAVDFAFERTPRNVIEKFRPFFDNLKPSAAVQERIDESRFSEDVVCVHVRNSLDKKDHKDVADLETVMSEMSKFPDKTKFFISTMDASISDLFRNRFRNRIKELDAKNYKCMIDAVADMYLLGIGRELLVSPGSTFSEVSWWLGGCKQRIVQMECDYRQWAPGAKQ